MTDFGLVLNFTSEDDLIEFLEDFRSFKENKLRKMLKKSFDARDGKHIKEIHKAAKELHEANPLLTYRQCFKLMSKKPNENIEII